MLRMFEVKQQNKNAVYEQLAATYGNYRSKNYEGYREIIRQGYFSNFVVFRCLSEIQKAARKIEFKVYRRTKNESEIIENHPLELLMSQPNGMYYGSELKNRAILFYYIAGEAPFHFMQNTFKNHLYTYRPDRVRYSVTGDEMDPYKDVVYEGSAYTPIDADNFFLWKNYNPLDDLDGLGHGISRLRPIFKELDQYGALTNWNLSLLENGGHLTGIISSKEVLSDTAYERAKKELKQQHQGSRNVGKFMLLEGDSKYQDLGKSPKDMDHLELRKSIIRSVHSNLDVDPLLTGFNEYSSYNNKVEASKGLYNKTVIPLLKDWSDCLNMFFSKAKLLKANEFVGLDTSDIMELQKDTKEIVDRLEKSKMLTENEKRAELGKEEIPGLDIVTGQNYIYDKSKKKMYIPMNFIDIDAENEDIAGLDEKKGYDTNFMY